MFINSLKNFSRHSFLIAVTSFLGIISYSHASDGHGHFRDGSNVEYFISSEGAQLKNGVCKVIIVYKIKPYPGDTLMGPKIHRSLRVEATDVYGTLFLGAVYDVMNGLTDRQLAYYNEKFFNLLRKKGYCTN